MDGFTVEVGWLVGGNLLQLFFGQKERMGHRSKSNVNNLSVSDYSAFPQYLSIVPSPSPLKATVSISSYTSLFI